MQSKSSSVIPELRRDAEGLSLAAEGMVLRGDFMRLLPRVRSDRLGHELLVRASRIRNVQQLSAIDATAGLGEDAFLLAASGFTVSMFERNHVVASLLADALKRGAEQPQLAPIISRMHLIESDSILELPRLKDAPCIVFLDPMFPAKTHNAASRKKAQLLQLLELPCPDESELLKAAFSAHPRKIVVKRPRNGSYLAAKKPSYSLEGKTIRYDCYLP